MKEMDRCERIRDLIADAVSANGGRMPEEVERHIEGCAECSEYLSAVLRDDERLAAMAGSMEESIRRVERLVNNTVKDGKRPAGVMNILRGSGGARSAWWTGCPRMLKPLSAAAAVLLVLWAFSGRLGTGGGSPEAFARAIHNAARAENVVYKETFHIQGACTFSSDVAINRAGVRRSTSDNGDVMLYDFNKGLMLQIPRHADRAELVRSVGRDARRREFDYIKWLSGLHTTSGTFVGCERIGTKETHRYSVDGGKYFTSTVWVDPAANLPVQIERVYECNIDSSVVLPRIALNLADFGGKDNYSRVISISNPNLGIHQIMKVLAAAMTWNVALDESLFSFEPPKGYGIVEREHDDSFEGEKDLTGALSLWAQLSGGSFPEKIGDLADSTVVNGLLIAAYDGDKDPDLELDEAMKAANTLLNGLYFAMQMKIQGVWIYNGRGTGLGDSKKPICWYRNADESIYRVVYGDLRIAGASADELPGRH